MGIRIRESGQVFIFSADEMGFWAFLGSHLAMVVEAESQESVRELN